ncbi:MAG TPA: hypothetical protein VHG32_25190 [Thermoanaerobaculia bacterium]|jgi:hypothetical protein|nr:hypothetical protein [Thermoanaerobaculia bacterium]
MTTERGVGEQPRRSSPGVVRRDLPDAATLDLSHYSRKVQRALYELTVAYFWTPSEIAPPYSPEEAGLRVIFWRRRWFATYRALEDADSDYLSPPEHEPLLRITFDATAPCGLRFNQC